MRFGGSIDTRVGPPPTVGFARSASGPPRRLNDRWEDSFPGS